MGLDMNIDISVIAVFIQGLLSFFSPCVLPLIPVYMGYLAGGLKTDEEFKKNQLKIFVNTFCFIIGISCAFFLLGLGFTTFGQVLSQYSNIITIVGGIIIILFGLYCLGLFGYNQKLSQEKRLNLKIDRLALNPLTAVIFGFTFSFAWTPCVGPILTSVLLMTSSAATMSKGLLLIGVYTLGFVIPFLLLGAFTGVVLNFFKKPRGVVQYTTKIGGIIMIIMGVLMISGLTDSMNKYLSNNPVEHTEVVEERVEETKEVSDLSPNINFTLMDQNGDYHTLSDYKGKVIFLNFWATWCGPCQSEMDEIQELYEEYGYNEKDVVILGVANPSTSQQNNADVSVMELVDFIENMNLSYPTVMDLTGEVFAKYGITAFPTTFMINKNGEIEGYISGALTKDMMINIIEQTLSR